MVRAGVIKLDIFPPGGCPEGLCAFLLIFLLKASRVSPKTDRGITGYSQNCLQKNEKTLSTSTSPRRNFAVNCFCGPC